MEFISDIIDVFVLLLHSYIDLSLSTTIFLEGADSNRNVIYTGKTVEKHTDVVPSLLADHTLSKCDSMPELYGLGKKLVCYLLQKSPLQLLVETSPDISDVIQEGKTFIAANYGITSTTDISEIRFLEILQDTLLFFVVSD